MKILTYKVFLCITLSMTSSMALCAQKKQELQAQINKSESLNYGTHIIAGGVAQVALLASAIGGFVVGEIAARRNVATWVHRTFNLNPPLEPGFLTENFKLLLLTRLIPLITCATAGLYVMYKMPQWTDTYLLNKDNKRTTKKNIITFLNRFLIPYPVGVCTGEYFSQESTSVEQKA